MKSGTDNPSGGCRSAVNTRRVQLPADACGTKGLSHVTTDALVTKGSQVEVEGRAPYGAGQADKLGTIRPGLPVVLAQVGMKVHDACFTTEVKPVQALSGRNLPAGSFAGRGRVPTLCGMTTYKTVRTTRWENFRLLAEQVGGLSKAAELLGKSAGQVSHFGGERAFKAIGTKVARQIETAFDKPEGWLDVPHGEELFPAETRQPSQDAVMIASTLAEAEKWVRFEESKGATYQPLRRAERLIELYSEIARAGGSLPPEQAETIINAARVRLQGGKHGRAGGSDAS